MSLERQKIGALSFHSKHGFSKSKFTISSLVLALNMEGYFLLQIPLIWDVISWRTFSTTIFLKLTFFSIALAMRCSKPEAIAFPRTARSSFNSFCAVWLGYSTKRYTFVLVIDRSEISRGVFGVEDDIGPKIPDDSTQFGAQKIESGAIGLMAPKPKTGGSFVKADTQTLSGGFKLAGNGGPHKISADGLEFDNLLIRRGPLLSNFCLTPSTICLTFLRPCCRHSTCYNTSNISRGSRCRCKHPNRLEVSDELTHQSAIHSCERSSLSPQDWEFYPYTNDNLVRLK